MVFRNKTNSIVSSINLSNCNWLIIDWDKTIIFFFFFFDLFHYMFQTMVLYLPGGRYQRIKSKIFPEKFEFNWKFKSTFSFGCHQLRCIKDTLYSFSMLNKCSRVSGGMFIRSTSTRFKLAFYPLVSTTG